MQDKKKSSKDPIPIYVATYIGMLLVLFVGSFFSEARAWGISLWSHLPAYAHYWLPALGLLALAGIHRWSSRSSSQSEDATGALASNRLFWIFSLGLGTFLAASFWIFRGETHFLGDGYQLLARLSSGAAVLKSWEASALYLQRFLFSLFDGDAKSSALLTFQIISLVSGILFFLVALLGSRALFSATRERMLFLLGLLSGGYMLLFFGYVENYPLFVVGALAFTLAGLLAALGKLNPWWLLPLALVTSTLHVFGVTLFPAMFYLLVRDRAWFVKVNRLPSITKGIGLLLIGLVGMVTYFVVYSNNYFFRFSVLPLASDQFTVEGETLLAPRRLADLLNLLIMLVPGLPVLAASMLTSRTGKKGEQPDLRFLMILCVSTFGATFIFNPKLGLPRDWDLFSFCAMPLATLLFYLAVKRVRHVPHRILAVALAICLGFLALSARVATQAIPSAGIAQFRDYIALDRLKNRNARNLIVDYYLERGDSLAAANVKLQLISRYPEVNLNERGKQLIIEERHKEAVPILMQAIALSPMYYDAYSNLGSCYFRVGLYSDAMRCFQIADGLNPHNITVTNNIGMAYVMMGDFDHARKQFTKVLEFDSTFFTARVGMAKVYMNENKSDSAFFMLGEAYRLGEIGFDHLRDWADLFLSKGATAQAAQLYSYALKRGLDSAYVRKVQDRSQQLILP